MVVNQRNVVFLSYFTNVSPKFRDFLGPRWPWWVAESSVDLDTESDIFELSFSPMG
jgi:hypothetical protein